MKESELSPLMRQYWETKRAYQDAIVLFRVGDFYEMFFKDAEEASKILNIALTSREKTKADPIPLCGVPYHAATGYIAKLLKAGRTVALCEQVEDPKAAKGLVRREVVRLYTPGTLFDAELLPAKESNFLASVFALPTNAHRDNALGLAAIDLSTGEFWVSEFHGSQAQVDLFDELIRVEPQELIHPEDLTHDVHSMLARLNLPRLAPLAPSCFEFDRSPQPLQEPFTPAAIQELTAQGLTVGVQAARALLGYLHTTQPTMTHGHVQHPQVRQFDREMHLDNTTIRNLELTRPLMEGQDGATLLSILDLTITSMGSRLLRQWIVRPLVDVEPIQARLEAVSELSQNLTIRTTLRSTLKDIQDLERLSSRVSLGTTNPRELLGLKHSVAVLPNILGLFASLHAPLIKKLATGWDDLNDVQSLLERTILPDAPISSRDGDIIQDGYHAQVDELRKITKEGTRWITELETQERTRTGIDSLKIKFNQVFGYYFEVTKANLSRVPSDYIRKQTLVNAERFTTVELTKLEQQVTGADQQLKNLEHELFGQIRLEVARHTTRIQTMSQRIAALDVIAGLAEAATLNRYVRPEIDDGGNIMITDGRHPVVTRMPLPGGFVPNDTQLDLDANRLLLITGPNMAGKSTYLRQVALIVLMAQIGSFVPAREAHIGLVDRIFTRVGASDNLVAGQSTFMVEMTETARILVAATTRSLILLDEVGRGTSTYDGLSIAWAVAEYIQDRLHLGARTLFATHYHEMSELERLRDGIKNYTVSVKEQNQDILFLRKIIQGRADRSYGIHVARLAGLPTPVLDRAQEVLSQLEQAESGQPNHESNQHHHEALTLDPSLPHPHPIIEEVKQMDLFAMTPLEALNRLADLQQRLESEEQ